MIRCWTVWRAVAAARPRPVAAVAAVTVVRRVRRVRRAVTAPIVLYPTIVCSVVGVGGAGAALFPWREGAEGAASGAQVPWREGATGAVPRYEFTGDLGVPLSPIQPTQVPEPESLLLLGAALLAMFVGAIWRREHTR